MSLTYSKDEQRGVFKKIMEAVNNQKGGVFFLYDHGGTGVTPRFSNIKIS